MKVYVASLCISAILCSAYGGLLKDVVGTIHEKAHNIREDIRSVLHHKDDNHSKNNIPDTDVKHSTTEKIDSGIITNIPDIKTETTTEKAGEVINIDTRKGEIVFPTDEAKPSETQAEAKPTESDVESTTTSASKTPTNEKDGRENFTGGCATGFKKTADGRCKPTF